MSHYELRDSEGRFVGQSRSRVGAHRASRSASHLGASVNRVGGDLRPGDPVEVYQAWSGGGVGREPLRDWIGGYEFVRYDGAGRKVVPFTDPRPSAIVSITRGSLAGVEVRYAVDDIRAARSRSGLNRANGDAPGGTVPYKKSDAERFAKLRTDFLAKHKAQNDYRISLAVKYGSFEQARSWASRGEKTRLEKLQAAEDKPRRKIYELIERINPQRGFGHGFPSQWIAEDLTWEDAVTLGPMSVVPPASYGYTVQEMQVKAGPVRAVSSTRAGF